jgi:flagellar hook-associated protein 2
VPGLTLRLAAADPLTTMSVGVARDVDAGVAAIQKVVDTYNALAEFVDGQLAPPVAGAAAKPLHGDAVLRSMRSALRASLNGVLDGDITGGLTRLPEIGIEIDRAGRYKVDATKLRAAVENSSEAVARLMGTFGTTSNSSVSFLGATDASGSGTYAVQITQAAAQAALTGAGFAATYVDDGTPDTLTVRDVGSDRGYAVSLSSGMTLSDIVNALNAQFALAREHVISAGAAFDSDVAGTAADDATAWSDLHIGGTNAGVATGDVLTISGTRPNGGSFLTSVVVSAGGTLGELRSAVQDALGSDVDVTWEDGVLTASAKEAGSALFTFTISSDNGGGGTLDFGGFSVTQQGRGTASIVASDSGGQLRLTHQDYGASVGFEVSFAAGGADGSASLGLATGTVLGANVAGTIGGFAATGTGRTLIGNAGTAVAGLKLSYDGAGTGAVGTLSFSRGLAAQLEDAADILLGSDSGSIRSVTERLSGSITRYESRITRLELRLDAREEQLIKRFTALEAAMATAQSQSAWLEAQLSQFQSSRQS